LSVEESKVPFASTFYNHVQILTRVERFGFFQKLPGPLAAVKASGLLLFIGGRNHLVALKEGNCLVPDDVHRVAAETSAVTGQAWLPHPKKGLWDPGDRPRLVQPGPTYLPDLT
jgi:hypothetical protein